MAQKPMTTAPRKRATKRARAVAGTLPDATPAMRHPGKTASGMAGADMTAWRLSLDWTQSAAALALGLSLGGLKAYEQERRAIPKSIELLCKAYRDGWRPV